MSQKNTIEYHSSAFEDDNLEIGLYISRLGERSVTIFFEIYRQGEEDILVKLETIFVSYDSKNRCSQPFKKILADMFKEALI